MSEPIVNRVTIETFPAFMDGKGLDFTIADNFIYLYGRNGCGKSILFYALDSLLNMSLYRTNLLHNCKEIEVSFRDGSKSHYGFEDVTEHNKRYDYDEKFRIHTIRNTPSGAEVTRKVDLGYYDEEDEYSVGKKKKKKDDGEGEFERKCRLITHVDCYNNKDKVLEELSGLVSDMEVGCLTCHLYNLIFQGNGGWLRWNGGKCFTSPSLESNDGMDIRFMSFGCWKIYLYLCRICHAIANGYEMVFLIDDFEFVLTPTVMYLTLSVFQSLCKKHPNIQIMVAGHDKLPYTAVPEKNQRLISSDNIY